MTKGRFWWQDRKLDSCEKDELISSIEYDANFNEVHYHGCSQAVLDAMQKNLGIGNVEVFKSASAMAGGICSMGEVCGAVTGGIMAIGLVYGREPTRLYREGRPELPALSADGLSVYGSAPA